MALGFLSQLRAGNASGLTLLAAGTDGEDGPTDAAGAWADLALFNQSVRLSLIIDEFRKRSRSYDFFQPLGGLFKTGPTGTNVMDLRVLLISSQPKL